RVPDGRRPELGLSGRFEQRRRAAMPPIFVHRRDGHQLLLLPRPSGVPPVVVSSLHRLDGCFDFALFIFPGAAEPDRVLSFLGRAFKLGYKLVELYARRRDVVIVLKQGTQLHRTMLDFACYWDFQAVDVRTKVWIAPM